MVNFWACTSLLHVETAKMYGVLQLVGNTLKCDGVLYVSYKYGQDQRSKVDVSLATIQRKTSLFFLTNQISSTV